MRKVVMHYSEQVSTRESTDRLVKTLEITYAKADLEQVDANATHMNAEDRNQLLRIFNDF